MDTVYIRLFFISPLLLLSTPALADKSISLRSLARSLISPIPAENDVCREAGNKNDTREKTKQYRCNEYPFGSTNLGMSRKEFEKIKKPTDLQKREYYIWRSKKEVFRETLNVKGKNLQFTIHANRMANIDREEETRPLELADGKIIRDRLRASRGLTYFQVVQAPNNNFDFIAQTCTFYPGITLTGQSVGESWKKSFLFFSAKASVTIAPGAQSFSHMRICSKVGFDSENTEAPLKVIKLDAPKIYGLKRVGLKVHVDGNWLMSIGDFFSSITSGSSISDKIENVIEKKGEEHIRKQLQSGEYINGLMKPVYSRSLKLITDKVNAANKTLREELREGIRSSCEETISLIRPVNAKGRQYCAALSKNPALRRMVGVHLTNSNNKEIEATPWIRVNRYNNSIAHNFSIEVDTSGLETFILREIHEEPSLF